MKYWLVKSEPDKYSWDDLVKEGRDHWDGVRNYQARNNLRAMKIADRVLFYHSVKGKAVVGVAKVVREAYQDPTTADQRWSAVDLEPVAAFSSPVTLSEIKAHPALGNMALLRQGRLSVTGLSEEEYRVIVELGN
ncbi:MAG: EVE domain-containing protein [Candidatus Binatia bacterium]